MTPCEKMQLLSSQSLNNPLKIKEKLNFTILNNTANYTLYPKILISIQVNDKLDVGVQNKTSVII